MPLPYRQAVKEWKAITSELGHPMYGMNRNDFAVAAEAKLRTRAYNTLKGTMLDKAAFHIGSAVDWLGKSEILSGPVAWVTPGDQSPANLLRVGFKGLGQLIDPDDQELIDTMEHVGEEMFGTLVGLGSFAIPMVGWAVGPVLSYSDAYNDALEEGRSIGEARGSGAIMAAMGRYLGPTGRMLGGKGKGVANRLSTTMINRSLNRTGITDKKLLATLAKKAAAKGKVTLFRGLPGGAKTVKGLSKIDRKLIRGVIKQGGLTGYGVSADLLDAWWFNENLSPGQLLTERNYLIPMLAGDSFGMITGSVIQKRGWRHKKGRAKRKSLIDDAMTKAQEELVKIRRQHLPDTPMLPTELTAHLQRGVELVSEENANPMGDTKVSWIEDGQTLFEFYTDKQNRVLGTRSRSTDVYGDLLVPADSYMAMLALRKHFGEGVFEYVDDGSARSNDFITNVLPLMGEVAKVHLMDGRVYSVTPLGKLSFEERARAAHHLIDEGEMPLIQGYPEFIERFIRAAEYGDVDANRLRAEGRRIFKFYKDNGIDNDSAMRRTLKLVESPRFKTFYGIYYGEAANRGDRDLARVLKEQSVRRGNADDLGEIGTVFWHDDQARTTLVWQPIISEEGTFLGRRAGIDLPEGRVMKYEGGIKVGTLDEASLTVDQLSARELAVGQIKDLKGPKGVTVSPSMGRSMRLLVTDLFVGLGLSHRTRLIMVNASDLDNPKTLREMGLPFLANYANVSYA